jgi:hypothetical protein
LLGTARVTLARMSDGQEGGKVYTLAIRVDAEVWGMVDELAADAGESRGVVLRRLIREAHGRRGLVWGKGGGK